MPVTGSWRKYGMDMEGLSAGWNRWRQTGSGVFLMSLSGR